MDEYRRLSIGGQDQRYTVYKEDHLFLKDFDGSYLVKSDTNQWAKADIFFEMDEDDNYEEFKKSFEDELKKAGMQVTGFGGGRRGLPVGTRRMRQGVLWEKTPQGWRPVPKGNRKPGFEDEDEQRAAKTDTESHRYIFSQIESAKVKEYAEDAASKNPKKVARFLTHDGKTKDGVPIKDIARWALTETAKREQEMEKLMGKGQEEDKKKVASKDAAKKTVPEEKKK